MWIGVFKPNAVRRAATDASAQILKQPDPAGEYCRRLPLPALARLEELFSEIAATHDRPGLFNAGLSYALLSAWRHFEHAADVPVRDVHPAVERAARLIRDETTTLGLDELARRSGLSPSRLSRLFKQQTGIALVDF